MVAHRKGKITPDAILKKLKSERAFGLHSTSPRVLSLTQPTEFGTVYTLSELQELSRLCKEKKLLLHIDGSRLFNALVHLKISLKEFTQKVSIDLLSLGGTKNGLMFAELLALINPALHEGANHIHKQTLQLVSKMRYLSAQFIPFFEKEICMHLATYANQKAEEISL